MYLMSTDDGQFDLHTRKGGYEYLCSYLKSQGAGSDKFELMHQLYRNDFPDEIVKMDGLPPPSSLSIIRNNLEMIHAVLTLEYHNKNFLSLDNAKRNRTLRSLISVCLAELESTEQNFV